MKYLHCAKRIRILRETDIYIKKVENKTCSDKFVNNLEAVELLDKDMVLGSPATLPSSVARQ